jgi:outer membrane protein assembly factor BamB
MTRMRGRRAKALSWRTLLPCLMLLAGVATGVRGAEEEVLTSAALEGRKVIVPPDLALTLDWYSPIVDPVKTGQVVRGWVKDDLILLETDKNTLIAVRRSDGTERWQCTLEKPLSYEPVVSASNVFVIVNNWLTAIEKRTGEVRWRLLPRHALSCTPAIVDPPLYPREYKKDWTPLEQVYVGTWTNRFQAMTIRGRMYDFVREGRNQPVMTAPDFDILYGWHKNMNIEKAVVTTPPVLYEDALYYLADDKKVHAVTREGEDREPYLLQGLHSTWLTVSANSCYVGARDCYLYCLDRLTFRKKWIYAPGIAPRWEIYADEQPERQPYVFLTTQDSVLHALKINPALPGTKTSLGGPESFQLAWSLPKTDGIITCGERKIYLGAERNPETRTFKKVCAVKKDSGKLDWKSDSAGVRFYLQFFNAYPKTDQTMRLYAVTEDNRLLSFKERGADTGPLLLAKAPETKGAEVKAPAALEKKAEPEKAAEPEKKAEPAKAAEPEKKAEAKKAEEKKE